MRSARPIAAIALWIAACGGDANDEIPASAGGGGGGTGGQASTTLATGTGGAPTTSGAGGSGAGGAAPEQLTVLTWNLEDFPKRGDTSEVVAGILDALAPDLVALQEIPEEGAAFSLLDERLERYEGVEATEGDGFRKVALLHRTDRVTLLATDTVFEPDDLAFPRPMLTAEVTVVGGPDVPVLVGVVHLKAQLDEESEARRRTANAGLDGWIRGKQGSGFAGPILIVGDFNDELTDPPQWNVFGPLLEAEDGGFLTLAAEEAGEHTYLPFESFIDHAHLRGGGAFERSSAEVLALEQTVDGYRQRVSDHRPVLARVGLPPSP